MNNEYFNRYEFYNLGTYINGKYVLKNGSKKVIRDFLLQNTYYSERKLKSMSDIQLYQTYARIKATMRLYVKEIKKYVVDHPTIYDYKPTLITEEQFNSLDDMSYNNLSSLRRRLHIDKRYKPLVLVRDNKPKEIKKGNPEEFHQFTIDEYVNNQIEETCILITTEEAYNIFGKEFIDMTKEDLQGFGYRLAVTEKEKAEAIYMHEELKEKMITYIGLKNYISPDGDTYTEEELQQYNLEELKSIYQSFPRYYQGLPTFDMIKERSLNLVKK